MKIVQVGGGTAGWMTAFAISKSLPNVELTVIHNDKPIGVGEATFENIRHYHSFLGIDEKEFMKTCDSSSLFVIARPKLSFFVIFGHSGNAENRGKFRKMDSSEQ